MGEENGACPSFPSGEGTPENAGRDDAAVSGVQLDLPDAGTSRYSHDLSFRVYAHAAANSKDARHINPDWIRNSVYVGKLLDDHIQKQ